MIKLIIWKKKRGKRRDAQRAATLRAVEQIESLGYIDNPYEIACGVPRVGIHMAKYLSRQALKTSESNEKTRIEFHGIDEIPKK